LIQRIEQPGETKLFWSRSAPRPSEFALRAPDWWRDLILGFLFGGALVWAFVDALHWETFKNHFLSEFIWVAIPFVCALLSPRRTLTLFIGLSIFLFRGMFLVFLTATIWGAVATIIWFLAWLWLAIRVNQTYSLELSGAPSDTTILEFLFVIVFLGGGFYSLYLLRHLLKLG
jgi:hypothetical protein